MGFRPSHHMMVVLVLILAFVSVRNSSLGFQWSEELNMAKSLAELIPPKSPDVAAVQSALRISKRIDLFSCPDHRLIISAKANTEARVGHRLTETVFVFHHALTKGHCFRFDTQHFGTDIELFHLLLEPVFPSCSATFPNRTLQRTFTP